MERLAGKTALVTGAGSGIGKAIALLFAREGARVAVLDIVRERAESTCAQIDPEQRSALPLIADVRSSSELHIVMDRVAERFGGLHILVNNAGVARKQWFEQMTRAHWQEVWETNLTGTIECTRRALPLLRKERGAKIINIASVEVYSHSRKLSAYSASKGALASLSRSLAVELAPQICVNYICPGFIRTEMTRPYYQRWLFRKYVERQTPLRRMGEPEEVARVALFLASADADFVTGQGITVDGGLTLRGL